MILETAAPALTRQDSVPPRSGDQRAAFQNELTSANARGESRMPPRSEADASVDPPTDRQAADESSSKTSDEQGASPDHQAEDTQSRRPDGQDRPEEANEPSKDHPQSEVPDESASKEESEEIDAPVVSLVGFIFDQSTTTNMDTQAESGASKGALAAAGSSSTAVPVGSNGASIAASVANLQAVAVARVEPVPTDGSSINPIVNAAQPSSQAQPFAAPPTTEATLPQPEPPQTDPNVARVARGLQNALNQRGGTVTLRLHPPELGHVRINVEIQGGVVRAQFQTEQESVRNLLNHQMHQLRQTLESQGLHVERLNVHTQAFSQSNAGSEQSLREEAGDGRSRGSMGQQPRDGESRGDGRSPQDRRSHFEQQLINLVG